MKKFFGVYIIISIITAMAVTATFAQATPPAAEKAKSEAPVAPAVPAAPVAPQAKEISIYGEVQTVNAANNTIAVQYYDYDSDSEKTAEVSVGSDAKLENAKMVGDVKKGDWVDVTYVVSGGKNMAKTVSVEKEEPVAEPTAAAPAETPAGE